MITAVLGASYQGGARIYTFLATSVPDSLTYYTPGMFTPSAVIQGFHSSPRSVVYSTTSNYTYSNWYAIGSNGTKRLLLQNTASTFDQSNKILDLPDYSRQVIKINV